MRLTRVAQGTKGAGVEKLARGAHAFRSNYFATHRDLFEQLATNGQKPETLFITCSDSRIDPNLITGAIPGELFTIRNVGNIVPSVARGRMGGVAAAIEYAVRVLNVENIIVCGHTQCGAMEAIIDPTKAADLPFVRAWLSEADEVRPILEHRYQHLVGPARVTAAVEENVLIQLENLRTFDFVADRLEKGTLKINGWVFKIATGEVFDYDPHSEQFVLLLEAADAAPAT